MNILRPALKRLHRVIFKWQVAECGYEVQHPTDTAGSDCAALISRWPEIQTSGILGLSFDHELPDGIQSLLEERKVSRIAPIDENPTYKEIMPLRRKYDPHDEKKLLFIHFREIDVFCDDSIIDFVNEFGLLINHEYSQYNTRKFELTSNILSFFKREIRNYQEIFALHECLSQSSKDVGEYLDGYYEKRFKCDDNNFRNSEKDFLCALLSKRGISIENKGIWFIIDDEIRQQVDNVLAEVEKSDKNDDDPYYLNDYPKYQIENAGYPLDGALVSDLDFRDYLQKKEELEFPEKVGQYYLEKWLDIKFTRFTALQQKISDEGIPSQPLSLLSAIYLQFSDSLNIDSSIDFCAICKEYDIRARTAKDEIKAQGIIKDDWHDHQDDEGSFAYHNRCSKSLQKRIRNHKIGVQSFVEKYGDTLSWKKPYLHKKPIELGPRVLMNIEAEYKTRGRDSAFQFLRKILEEMGWL